MNKWNRLQSHISFPLGEDGHRITGSPKHLALSRRAAEEGMVLLKNEQNILPLKKGSRVALFGNACADYVKGGEGSGDVTVEKVWQLYEALQEKEKDGYLTLFAPLYEFYEEQVSQLRQQDTYRCGYMDEITVPQELFEQAVCACDTAILCINRNSCECDDLSGNLDGRDYYLAQKEKELVKKVTANFEKVVVVLNTGIVMDTAWCAHNLRIQGVLLGWQGGNMGAFATADILCGDVNPSGKLNGTMAASLEDYPSTASYNASPDYVEYTEDIYVGYRYFSTIPGASARVLYPFGYGLSYTTFEISSVAEVTGETIHIAVTVKNVGAMAGKEVVQVYSSSPKGKLDKPAYELRGFAKTPLLQAGESCQKVIEVAIADMASYDERTASYIMEAGTYRIFVGISSLDMQEVLQYHSEERCIKKVTNRCIPRKLSKRLQADGSYQSCATEEYPSLLDTSRWESSPYWKYTHADLLASDPKVPDFRNFPDAEEIKKFIQVQSGDLSMDDFISQLGVADLLALTSGCPNQGIANTSGIGDLPQYGVPAMMTTDGPAGVRLTADVGVYTTAFPCGSLMACTWNEELISLVASAGAAEAVENNFAIWLTPGMNIHRSPLCGRNFEYFSEDPLLSGKVAAAVVRGIQSQGVSACIKHLCCNNKEFNRYEADSRVSERALREIYLKGFEIAVKEGSPLAMMTSYNRMNGCFTSENGELLRGIVREEWGFTGLIISDWGCRGEPYRELLAGNNVHMPYTNCDHVCRALKEGLLTIDDLRENARFILSFILKVSDPDDSEV